MRRLGQGGLGASAKPGHEHTAGYLAWGADRPRPVHPGESFGRVRTLACSRLPACGESAEDHVEESEQRQGGDKRTAAPLTR
jgi:hypothetical protein